jgi:hypothetical protein
MGPLAFSLAMGSVAQGRHASEQNDERHVVGGQPQEEFHEGLCLLPSDAAIQPPAQKYGHTYRGAEDNDTNQGTNDDECLAAQDVHGVILQNDAHSLHAGCASLRMVE